MSKKYLRKNEFRLDLNQKHYGKKEKPHPAYITAKRGKKFRANSITHSRKTTDGRETFTINENPNKSNKKNKDERKTRISEPYWQNEKQFSQEKLTNFRFSKRTRIEIAKINKKYP